MSEVKVKNPNRVSVGKMIAWQMRPISLGAITIIFGYLSIFCTDMLGMPAALVGTLLMASKIFDGITDLIAGWIVDNTNTKLGKGRPYELCLIGAWICTYALFAASDDWSMTVKSIWLFIMYTLVWSFFSTMLNAAETPYIIRAFHNKMAITKVSAYGGIIVTVGGMAVSITLPMVIASVATNLSGWRLLILMYGIPLLLIGLIRFFVVKEETIETETTEERIKVKDILKVLTSNRYVWLLGIASLVPQMIVSMGAATYYFTWIVGDISLYSIIQFVGIISLIYLVIMPAMMKKHSAMQIVGISAVVGLIGYMILFFAGANIPLLIVGTLLSGVSSLPLSYMRSVIVIQIADYNEFNHSPRMEGTLASAVNFLCKIGTALGSFLLGVMLSVGGYDGTAAAQTESAQMMIRVNYAIIPAVCMVLVILCAIAYRPLDRWTKEHNQNAK